MTISCPDCVNLRRRDPIPSRRIVRQSSVKRLLRPGRRSRGRSGIGSPNRPRVHRARPPRVHRERALENPTRTFRARASRDLFHRASVVACVRRPSRATKRRLVCDVRFFPLPLRRLRRRLASSSSRVPVVHRSRAGIHRRDAHARRRRRRNRRRRRRHVRPSGCDACLRFGGSSGTFPTKIFKWGYNLLYTYVLVFYDFFAFSIDDDFQCRSRTDRRAHGRRRC